MARNAMLPRNYPERAISTRHAPENPQYALALTEQAGIDAPGAGLVQECVRRPIVGGRATNRP